MNVTIKDCLKEKIKVINKNNDLFKCENPICNDDCPEKEDRAICVQNENNESVYVNNIENNYCKCLEGWTGDKCMDRDLEDFR